MTIIALHEPLPPPPPPTLTALSYNVNFARAGDPDTLRAIADADAEVVFLQETNAAWEQALRARFSSLYPHLTFRHCDRAGGLAVLSRLPFTEREYLDPPPGAWFPAWRVLLETGLGPVQVLQLHLRSPIDDRGRALLGYFSTRPIREREIAAHIACLEPGVPTLVVGDFNESLYGRVHRFLRRRGIVTVLAPGQSTWRWPTRWGNVRQQLDHIAHDALLRPLGCRVLDAGGSDHLPVFARFAAS